MSIGCLPVNVMRTWVPSEQRELAVPSPTIYLCCGGCRAVRRRTPHLRVGRPFDKATFGEEADTRDELVRR